MKTFYLIFILLGISIGSNAQEKNKISKDSLLIDTIHKASHASGISDYEVVMVNGIVTNNRNLEQLQVGSQFAERDQLHFSGIEDRLVLIDQSSNIFIAAPEKGLDHYKLEAINTATSTREGKITSYLGFVNYLHERKLLVLGGKAVLELSADAFPMDDQHFFYIEYSLANDPESVNKILAYEENYLIFSQYEIFQVDGSRVDPNHTSNHTLFYYNEKEETSLKINKIQLVFPDDEELKKQIGVLVNHFGKSPLQQESLMKAIEGFLFNSYGVPDKEDLAKWLLTNFEIHSN